MKLDNWINQAELEGMTSQIKWDANPVRDSAHQWGSLSDGIPRMSEAIIPIHVPIWLKVPNEPLYFVGAI